MFELDDRLRRQRLVEKPRGVEQTACLGLGNEHIKAGAEQDMPRGNAQGRASSVHFLHFPFTAAEIRAFRTLDIQRAIGVARLNYSHTRVFPKPARQALGREFEEEYPGTDPE